MKRYLRIDPDAIEPDADQLWSAVGEAKELFSAALQADLDEEVMPRLTDLQARMLSLIARPARSAEEVRRKLVSLEFVRCYEEWFPTRALTMGEAAVSLDLADLGLSLDEIRAQAAAN